MTDEPVALTVREAARVMRVSERTVWRGISANTIPVRRIGRTVRVLRQDIESLRLAETGGGTR